MKKALAFFLTLTVAWAFLVGLVILSMGVPETRTQWIMAVIVGPPLYVAAEAFFEWHFSKQHGERISAKPFSLLRILVALAVMLVVFGAVAFVTTISFGP
jgi:uncharacterized membrane protein YidH (DUF202 family)